MLYSYKKDDFFSHRLGTQCLLKIDTEEKKVWAKRTLRLDRDSRWTKPCQLVAGGRDQMLTSGPASRRKRGTPFPCLGPGSPGTLSMVAL